MSVFSAILILLLPIAVDCSTSPYSSSCPASSCGNLTNIRFPFRLKTDPINCGFNHPDFQLDCHNNHTVLSARSGTYYVQEINYSNYTIRLLDPGLFNRCPTNALSPYSDWSSIDYYEFKESNTAVAFVHCGCRVNSSKYMKADFCGNKSSSPFSQFYSYVVIGGLAVSDVEESCVVDKLTGASDSMNSSSETIYDALNYGFELNWYRVYCDKTCDLRYQYCLVEGNNIICRARFTRFSELVRAGYVVALAIYGAFLIGVVASYGPLAVAVVGIYGILGFFLFPNWIGGFLTFIRLTSWIAATIIGSLALKFLIGFPIMIYLVLCKWRRRHLSMTKTIEDFLRDQNNLTPIKYSYSKITKMTENFNQKLGEGRYGIVYRGKLQSGPFVAVKMMRQSMACEEEFITEVSTIGQIHHANVVQLIGYCVEGLKFGLVYEFLPNGSLDRYIFNHQSLGVAAFTYETMFEIALGIARGIAYLHHGCEMQILHFDIKPHNILLDENFRPKISDFGLAKLYATNDSVINLTDVRGTMGYMAPEMFYKNIGRVSYKADIYSFGMLLMEMIGNMKNLNLSTEDTSRIYFPSWVYEQFEVGKEIEIEDATIEEKEIINKIILVGLWCIQMKPCDRPPMNKVVQMLEGDSEVVMPPKSFLAPHGSLEDHHISQTYSVDCVTLESSWDYNQC